jgi:hypothetical protein
LRRVLDLIEACKVEGDPQEMAVITTWTREIERL